MSDKKKKVLILTDVNVSNCHFMLAEHLQSLDGFTVDLLVIRRQSFENSTSWFQGVVQAPDFDLSADFNALSTSRKFIRLIKYIRSADIVLVSGMAGGLVYLLKKPYIYFSYGSDLDQYAQYGCNVFELHRADYGKMKQRLKRFLRAFLYKRSIRNADITIIAQYQYPLVRLLGFKKLGFFLHLLEDSFKNVILEDKSRNSAWLREKYSCQRIIFSSTRHVWSSQYASENDFKGNDIVIESFRTYMDKTGDTGTKLLLVEKGLDVSRTKKLVSKLGMEQYVIWLEQMPRKTLQRYYSGADMFFDQFSKGCFALCAVEAMACGTITVSYIGERVAEVPFYDTPPCLLNTNNIEEIAAYIQKVFADKEFKLAREEDTYKWVRVNCSQKKLEGVFNNLFESLS
jgi:glycosyltransferase involved in cell wall biosynthesis